MQKLFFKPLPLVIKSYFWAYLKFVRYIKAFYFGFIILVSVICDGQTQGNAGYTVDADYFYGNIFAHSNSIQHLITEHPEGILISFNKKTFGTKEWQAAYNYPDYGASFHFEDTHNETLGDLYGLYAHYNFYFLKRNLTFRVAQGIAYNTNPYDKETNFRNVAYGSHWFPASYFMLNFRKEKLWQNLGFHAGFSFFHHSNATLRSPNTSTNTIAINIGLNYSLEKKAQNVYLPWQRDSINYIKQPIDYNITLRGGVNESDIIGSGQYPFFALSFNAEKRLSRKSAVQVGTDLFWHEYLREYIKFKSVAYPAEKIAADTDFRRIGVFIGHELLISRLSMEAQVGYYVYSPFKYLGPLYQRVGMKYYISDQIFGSMSLKTHGAKAEALEFGIGIKL